MLVSVSDNTGQDFVSFCIFFQSCNLFLSTFSIFVKLAPSLLDFRLILILILSSCQVENKAWKAELFQESSELNSISMDDSVKYKLTFSFCDEFANSLFTLCNRDITLEWFFLSSHRFLDVISDSLHVYEGAV